MTQDSGPFSHRTMFRFSNTEIDWPRWSGDGANQIITVTKTEIGLGGPGMGQSDRYCDKTEIGLGSLGMVPIRSLLSQFRLGILDRTLKVVLLSACPVFS